MSYKIDQFGAVASSLCAVHCAMTALAPVAFSVLGLGFLIGHQAEWFFTSIAAALGLIALIAGWRHHRSTKVAGVLAIGIVGLLASRGLEMTEGDHGHHGDSLQGQGTEMRDSHSTDSETKLSGGYAREGIEKHGGESEDSGSKHFIGAGVGILAGLILLVGHILNIRALRRRQDPCYS